MNRPKWVQGTLISLAALAIIWWNVSVFSLYAIAFVPIEFAAVVFLTIAITVVRSLCQRQDRTGGA